MPDRRADLLREKYPSVSSEVIRPLLNVFSAAREVCQGDTDKFLILMVIGMRMTEHPEFKKLSTAQLMAGEPAVLPSLGTNTRSIAASVQIPKETARRKLAELVEAGWLVRDRWDFRMTAKGYIALEPVRARIRAMALGNHAIVADLISR